MLIASLPSPGSGSIDLGPLTLRAYGLMIALGVLAAVWLAQRRWEQRGGAEGDIGAIAVVAVPAGLVGARLYHVITDWQTYRGRWLEAFEIWNGGLGIPGGMALGIVAGLWAGRRRGFDLKSLTDAVVPGLPLAQAIGRFGNWFNQELFGRPTDLPWALEIDPEHRPSGYETATTFHPTFLYEMLWNLAVVGLLIRLDRKKVLQPGRLVFAYMLTYAVGRLWIEAIRIDFAERLWGVRVNIWVMGVIALAGLVGVVSGLRRPNADADAAEPGDDPAGQAEPSAASDSEGQAR